MDPATLPDESADQVVVRNYPCVVRRAVARLENHLGEDVRELRSRMRAASKRLDETRTTGVWHIDELGHTLEQQRAARQLLHELERACDEAQYTGSTGQAPMSKGARKRASERSRSKKEEMLMGRVVWSS